MNIIVNSSREFRIYAFDKVVIGYCFLMVLLLLWFGRPIQQYFDEIVFYASMAAIAALIARFMPPKGEGFPTAIRMLYPGVMFLFFYRETGGTMFLLLDQFYDWQLTSFEKSVFGVYPTLYIDRHLLNVWLNEIFSFCYFAYYFMIPVFLLAAFIKKHYDVIRGYLLAACVAFFWSYILFFLYPIEGPRWHFASEYLHPIDGPVFRQMTEFVIAKGAVRGGCMPSSHFGVGLVTLMFTFKHYRRAGWLLLPVVIGLAVGTVWGRFHYVSDVVVGGLIGLISVILVWKYYPVSSEKCYNGTKIKEPAAENVS